MDFPSKNDNQLSLNDEITRFTQFLLGSPGQPLDLERNFDRFLSPAGTLRKNFQNYLITFRFFTQFTQFCSLTNRQKVREEGSEERS